MGPLETKVIFQLPFSTSMIMGERVSFLLLELTANAPETLLVCAEGPLILLFVAHLRDIFEVERRGKSHGNDVHLFFPACLFSILNNDAGCFWSGDGDVNPRKRHCPIIVKHLG